MGPFGDDDAARRRDAVRQTTPTPAGSVTPETDGVVAVEGVVRVHEETVAEPLADAEVVDPGAPGEGDGQTTVRTVEEHGPAVVTTYRGRPRQSTAPARRRVETVPFVVEDDDGRVLVDLTDAPSDAVVVSPGRTERLLGDEAGDRLVRTVDTDADLTRELARARAALGTTPDWEHARGTLRAGDHVYVLASPRRDGKEFAATLTAADTVVVSDLSRSALAEHLDRVAGGLDRRFWLFVVVGGIAAVGLLITVAVLVDSFLV